LAAEFFNTCRTKGVQSSNTDFLICSVSANHEIRIFTVDKDFYCIKRVFRFNCINQLNLLEASASRRTSIIFTKFISPKLFSMFQLNDLGPIG
jgi:hypothetical protein